MRIVSGSAKGRPLLGPKGPGIRPTADRVRESLFNTLGQTLDPIDVLDLYAGTGALALEAISRGAAKALLVDSSREAIELCEKNTASLGFVDRVEIWRTPVEKALEKLARSKRQFTLVFADPPYAAHAGVAIMTALSAGVISPGGLLVFEHDRREEPPAQVAGLAHEETRSYGDTRVTLYRQS